VNFEVQDSESLMSTRFLEMDENFFAKQKDSLPYTSKSFPVKEGEDLQYPNSAKSSIHDQDNFANPLFAKPESISNLQPNDRKTSGTIRGSASRQSLSRGLGLSHEEQPPLFNSKSSSTINSKDQRADNVASC